MWEEFLKLGLWGETAADTVLKNSNLCLSWGGAMVEKEGDSLP